LIKLEDKANPRRANLTKEEQTRIAKLTDIAARLRRRENVQNRQLNICCFNSFNTSKTYVEMYDNHTFLTYLKYCLSVSFANTTCAVCSFASAQSDTALRIISSIFIDVAT
jgi:predicted dithiol-disulfide oxidoreductase (DUF899 family)